ncbi:oxidoreductase [Rubrobacter taiwanensis]|jgi:acrylyl-CoA reductase (NADPH)|uniref:Oxidoreductase n=1 Tax=Rubrobacter taiwanensis TaxID=185139 RepID=A0A4R1BGU0_9ACTN|nr:oxidoreductase [Rubrobacter taiwanensis]TCJ16465.1 oxidoreductase [Rubrobacter taiwanensis]
MDRFQAYRVHEEDGKPRGRLEEITLDDLNEGEVLIRVRYSSVNYKDALAATGKGKIMRSFPKVAGIDAAGVVEASEDPRFSEGDEVLVTGTGIGEERDGGYAPYLRHSADWLVPLPEGLSLRDAMAIGTAGFTAALSVYRMEKNGLAPENGPVAVTGATGGVGSIAVDILAGLGYEVTAITGKESERDYLKELGAKEVVNRNELEMGERPLEKSMWAGAVDTVGGGGVLAWLTRTAKRHGSIAACGNAGGFDLNTTVLPFILRGVDLLGIDSNYFPMEERKQIWERLASDMRPRHLQEISHDIPFSGLPGAFDRLIEGKARGRMVVEIS